MTKRVRPAKKEGRTYRGPVYHARGEPVPKVIKRAAKRRERRIARETAEKEE